MKAWHLLALSALVLGGCTDANPDADAPPPLTFATTERLHPGDGRDVTIDGGLADAPPLALVSSEDRPLALLPDRLVEVDATGTTEILRFDPPVVGAEVAHSSDGTAVTAVTWALGGLDERTRLLWVDSDVEMLLDVPGNLPLVGVLPEGIVLRSTLGTSRLSLLGWDGAMVGLGIEAADAMLVPDTGLLVMRESEQDPMRILDIESGREEAADGLPADAHFSQMVASPTSSALALALDGDAGQDEPSTELWLLEGSPLAARPVVALDDTDVVAGFSDDGRWVMLVTDGERFDSEVVGVRLEDGEVAAVDLPADGTPLGWSRAVLTLQSLRPQQ